MMESLLIRINSADEKACMTGFYQESPVPRPGLIILPGGGYNHCAPVEGEPVAKFFAEKGYAAFVLNYSTRYGTRDNVGGDVNPHTLFPEPLRQLADAIKRVRKLSTVLNIAPDRIAVVGFSAGGHLAACYSSLWHTAEVCRGVTDQAEEIRPNACVLLYGAFSLKPGDVMLKAMFGDRECTQEEVERYCADRLVSRFTPPSFLFHSIPDPLVPYTSSANYARALGEAGIVHELHLFGQGGHAYGLGEGTDMNVWTALAQIFLEGIFERPESYRR